MIPVANFLVSPNLLVISFTDSSTGTPTSWSWDFGDGTALGTTQNPTHSYSIAGVYIVKLTATNSGGSSLLQRTIAVSTVPILPISLLTFVNIKLPAGNTVSEETKQGYIAQWQLYIQPLVTPAVSLPDVFNELAYPPLANALIAYLAAYSILVDIASGGGTLSAGAGTDVVKKIVTGPSEVEFQDSSNAQKAFFGKDGLATMLARDLCFLASRLMIYLPMCPPLPDHKILYLKAGRPAPTLWSSYPWPVTLTI